MKNIPVRQIKSPEEAEFSEEFIIRDISKMLSGKDMEQKLHRHDHYFILALKKGRGCHVIDFKKYQINNNSVFILRPGQVHMLSLKAGSTGYLLQFTAGFYRPIDKVSYQHLRSAGSSNICQLSAGSFKKLLIKLTSVYRESCEKEPGYKEIIRAELDIFLIELIRQRKSNNKHHDNSLYNMERIDELFRLLEENIASKKQAAWYAEKMNLTVYQLNSITKASIGKSCTELINEQIILESKRYLLATASQVNQIAYFLGYEDISYYIRFFKKHTGYSPKVFREKFI